MNFFEKIGDFFLSVLNVVLFRKRRSKKLGNQLLNCMDGGLPDEFLFILLNLMSLVFWIDKNYRRNIKNFNATYLFTDQRGDIMVGAVFEKNRLKVYKKKLNDPTVTLIFRDGKSLIKFLVSGSTDILEALLNQEINFTGNINYINKFAFMALHLVLEVKGEALL